MMPLESIAQQGKRLHGDRITTQIVQAHEHALIVPLGDEMFDDWSWPIADHEKTAVRRFFADSRGAMC